MINGELVVDNFAGGGGASTGSQKINLYVGLHGLLAVGRD